MNNKSRIYLAAHKHILLESSTNAQTATEESGKQSEIGKLLLAIAHLYIKEVASDESDYWMTFVFDTCSSTGLCSERYIGLLSHQQKRDYIQSTLKHRAPEAADINCSWVANRICELARRHDIPNNAGQIKSRQFASAILDYIHVLISIDRSVEDIESRFFCFIRDAVDEQMGWKERPFVLQENSSRQTKDRHGQTDSQRVEELIEKTNGLIGLSNIKGEVRSLINSIRVRKLRTSAGLPNAEVSNHMVFYGNPGTGKTTIARILGEVYSLLGILSKGHFIETDRSGLVGGYLGQTAIKTTEVLESALGGILFIDEAYSLSSSDGGDQYGQEAIDTILKFMEDHRDDIVVIAAGYEEQMGRFLQSNPGLKSRFNKYFRFEDYSADELFQIFLSICNESGYTLHKDAVTCLSNGIEELLRLKTADFGNGRTIRNLFEKTIANQANRIALMESIENSELSVLVKEDIRMEDIQELCGR